MHLRKKLKEDYHYEVTFEKLDAPVNNNFNKIDDQASTIQPLRISHIDGYIKYVEKKEEATAIDIMIWLKMARLRNE